MAPPRTRDLTDSQKEMAAIIEERISEKTPPMGGARPSDSSAEMRAIAYDVSEAVVRRNRPTEWVECERQGPAAKLAQRIDRVDEHLNHVDERVRAMEFIQTEERGANREIAKQAASRTAMQTMLISGVVAIVSVLLSAGFNRFWPPKQQTQPPASLQPSGGHP